MLFFLLLLSVLAVIFALLNRVEKPLIDNTLSNWTKSISGLQVEAAEFYERVQARIAEAEMPGVVMKIVSFHESGVFSGKRDYLRIRRGEYSYDLCMAPFGKSTFVSSWFCEYQAPIKSFMLGTPGLRFIAAVFIQLFDPMTYFRADAAAMFNGAVHDAVLAVLDETIAAHGLQPIPESERKPLMRQIYGKKAGV